jgi:hypothetical protein
MGFLKRLIGGERSSASWASFFQEAELEHFLELVGNELEKRELAHELGDGVINLSVGGEAQELGLQNLAQVCHQAGREHWSEVISEHFDAVLSRAAEAEELDRVIETYSGARPLLRLQLYPEDTFSGDKADIVVKQSVAPGVSAVLVFDLPSSIASVKPEQVESWGKSQEEVLAVALENLRGDPVLLPEVIKLDQGGSIKVLGESFFAACHVLFLERYLEHPESEHGALVSIPHRHVVLAHEIRDMNVVHVVNAMIPMTVGMFHEGPGSVSPQLYWWRKGTLTLLPSEIDGDEIKFMPPLEMVELLNRLASVN